MGAEIDPGIEDKQQLVDDMLKVLPEKAARNRRKHIVVRDCSTEQHIEADDKVIPGILTNAAVPLQVPRVWSSGLSRIWSTWSTAP